MTKVKICGLTNLEDARTAVSCGADFLGFIFYKKSPRYIAPEKAALITVSLVPDVFKVGVFVNEKPELVRQVASLCRLDFLQFHGDETPAYLKPFKDFRTIRAVRVKNRLPEAALRKYAPSFFLFDTYERGRYGGTGKTFDRKVFEGLKKLKQPFFVSGGLTPENVRLLVGRLRPYAVDVSSGVEKRPGVKDKALVKKFIAAVKGTETFEEPT